jgi:hypothetical protein
MIERKAIQGSGCAEHRMHRNLFFSIFCANFQESFSLSFLLPLPMALMTESKGYDFSTYLKELRSLMSWEEFGEWLPWASNDTRVIQRRKAIQSAFPFLSNEEADHRVFDEPHVTKDITVDLVKQAQEDAKYKQCKTGSALRQLVFDLQAARARALARSTFPTLTKQELSHYIFTEENMVNQMTDELMATARAKVADGGCMLGTELRIAIGKKKLQDAGMTMEKSSCIVRAPS